jgi:CheY-like chemotaxis protein
MSNEEIRKKKSHILIVEDDESIRFMLQNKLYKDGYNVTVAANGLHAMQVVRSGQQFDLILCDLKMPGKDGLEFFNAMKGLNASVPMVILTGYPDKNKIVQAIRNGVRDVILKPIKHQDLVQKIRVYLGTEEFPPKAA